MIGKMITTTSRRSGVVRRHVFSWLVLSAFVVVSTQGGPGAPSAASDYTLFQSEQHRRTKKDNASQSKPNNESLPPPRPTSPPAMTVSPTQEPTLAQSTDANLSDAHTILKATGLTMILAGVEPLDNDSTITWKETTRDFLLSSLLRSLPDTSRLKVEVFFVSQEPPYQGSRRMRARTLKDASNKSQAITFNTVILMESKARQKQDAGYYVANAFDNEREQTRYTDALRDTADAAFRNVHFISLQRQTIADEFKEPMAIGLVVALIVIGAAFVAATLFVSHGLMVRGTASTEDQADRTANKDLPSPHNSLREKTDTGRSSSDDLGNSEQEEEDQDDDAISHASSCYWQGSIEVALSADTDFEHTPRASNPKLLLRNSDDASTDEVSLFGNVGSPSERYTPTAGRKFDRLFEI